MMMEYTTCPKKRRSCCTAAIQSGPQWLSLKGTYDPLCDNNHTNLHNDCDSKYQVQHCCSSSTRPVSQNFMLSLMKQLYISMKLMMNEIYRNDGDVIHRNYITTTDTNITCNNIPKLFYQQKPHRRCSNLRRSCISSIQSCRRDILMMFVVTLLLGLLSTTSQAFVVPLQQPSTIHQQQPQVTTTRKTFTSSTTTTTTATPHRISQTSLSVWWYGGNEQVESNLYTENDDSCELVAVRIERTSSNSRRILGDITVAAPIHDVWSILTDYNRLSIHVPNLVESRIERTLSNGQNGDGQYQCRLYQKGAQKIIGFEFGASVTMDMKEMILLRSPSTTGIPASSRTTNMLPPGATTLNLSPSRTSSSNSNPTLREERKITFKCVDSFFFREFDGEWKVQEYYNTNTNTVETILSYVVDVRPKGPVPVAALEWRIREDVPTNLRAVKKAALNIASDPTLRSSSSNRVWTSPSQATTLATTTTTTTTLASRNTAPRPSSNNAATRASSRFTTLARDARTKVQWLQDETMATYLNNNNNNNQK